MSRFGLILFTVAAAWMAHIYTEGRYLKQIMIQKKYVEMAAVGLGALFLYWLFTKNPTHARKIIESSHEYMKYMPVDPAASSIIRPILNFTTQDWGSTLLGGTGAAAAATYPVVSLENRLQQSGGGSGGGVHDTTKTKRVVSETKKKYVAAKQGWKCSQCGTQLSAWFEVDHKRPLYDGGNNTVDNLRALCRECHGEITAFAKM